MKRIMINDLAAGRYIAETNGVFYNPESDHNISLGEFSEPWAPKVLGGVMYTGFTDVACFLHMAGVDQSFATKRFMWMVYDYPFMQLGLQRLFGVVRETNALARFIDRRMGFREVAAIPGMFAGEAGIVVCMEREDCRWIKQPPRDAAMGIEGDGEKGRVR